MKAVTLLKDKLMPLLPLNQARVTFIAQFVIALLDIQTCNLNTLSLKFKGKPKPESHYKRIQRFLRSYVLDFGLLAKAIVKLMPVGLKWILCVDRTNWKFGKLNINIMVLGIAYKGVCIPLLWSLLPKKGCSNTQERIDLMERFFKLFSIENIECVTADREFIGRRWMTYLKARNIPFRIRIKRNTQVRSGRSHQQMDVYRLFCGNQIGQVVVLNKKRKIWGLDLYVIGLRTANDYVILLTDHAPKTAMTDYKRRWDIEMLFSCLKKRGFDFEDTHLSKDERVSKLMALLTLAFCWCILQGEALTADKELKLKKHGYVDKSLFRRGLESLSNLISNISCKFKGFLDALSLFVL